MSVETSPEMFINIKRIPDENSSEYKAFFKEEQRKIKEGITINGTFIPPWLYWHLNHWNIFIDKTNPKTGYFERIKSKPYLRENEWIIGNAIYKAEKNRKGLLILGCRQFSKSETGASYEGFKGINFKNSQNVIASLSSGDLKLLLSKLDNGLNSLHPYFKPQRIKDQWEKEVVLGFKDNSGERYKYSEYLIRNLDGGKNTENLAGPTTSSILIEEIGKGNWLESFIAARPAIETEGGYRGLILALGSSGSFDKSEELQHFRSNLDSYNFNQIEFKASNGENFCFMPGFMASRAKRKKIRFSTYLKKPQGSELDIIAIHVVENIELEKKKIDNQIQAYEEANEFVLAKKERMYYAYTEEQLFLIDDADNVFSDIKQLAREHLTYLETVGVDEEYVWLERGSDGKIKVITAGPNEKPIQEFPTGEHEDKDAPIIVWDRPLEGQQFGILHCAGTDPYNQDESFYSPSLGVTYIYRRTYDPLHGKNQEQFVACYAARTKDIRKWREQLRLLLEWYGADDLPENEEPGLIRWFDDKNLGHYIVDGIDLAKEINPNTKVARRKGLSASSANIRYGNGLLKLHCTEDLVMGQDEHGDNIIKKGIIRIKDRALLKEIIASKAGISNKSTAKKKKAVNVDRIVAARHALINASLKDKFYPLARIKVYHQEEKKKRQYPRSPFNLHHSKGSFGKSPRNPFRTRI